MHSTCCVANFSLNSRSYFCFGQKPPSSSHNLLRTNVPHVRLTLPSVLMPSPCVSNRMKKRRKSIVAVSQRAAPLLKYRRAGRDFLSEGPQRRPPKRLRELGKIRRIVEKIVKCFDTTSVRWSYT